MYNINQYLAAAIMCGKASYDDIINKFGDKYHAESLEPGINKHYLFKAALVAEKRMLYKSIILIILLLINAQLLFGESPFLFGGPVLPLIVFLFFPSAIVLFIFERLNVKAARKIAQDNIKEDDLASHNLVVAGSFNVFGCFGISIDSWSFAIRTVSQDDGSLIQLPYYFRKELTGIIANKIRNIFPHADCSEKLFINGKDVRSFPEHFAGRDNMPSTQINQSIVDSYSSSANDYLRYYYVISEHAWDSQITVTSLIKFQMSGEYLYGNVEYYFTPPIKKNLLVLDRYLGMKGIRGLIKTFSISCLHVLPDLILSVSHILYLLSSIPDNLLLFLGYDRKASKIANDPEYNFGHSETLREKYADDEYHRYFQKDDKDRVSKLMQTAISDTVVKYLQDKGIDISDLKQNASIINSGIMISGGNVQAGNITTKLSAIVKRSFKKTGK